MKIGIVGTGYVGLVTGTCFAQLGHQVVAVDVVEEKINLLNAGTIPIFEPGLDEMLKPLINKKIHFTSDYKKLSDTEAIFIGVGTPSLPDGSADLSYIFSAVEMSAKVLPKGALMIMKSTVPVGTAKKVNEFLKNQNREDLIVVSNPEFLKEGAAIKDFMEPDRIVIGTASDYAAEKMKDLYQPLIKNHPQRWIVMSNVAAELTKYAANCFLAAKISFMNEMAQLCEAVGANVEEVKEGIGSDLRIGKFFLNPGPGYGGSCFPKDVKALINTANEFGVKLQVVLAAEAANKKAKNFAAEKLIKVLAGVQGKSIAVLGLAFKANTDDVRETSAIDSVQTLINNGARDIFVYDPIAGKNFMNFFSTEKKVILKDNVWDCVQNVDAVLILTEWAEFKLLDLKKLKNLIERKPIVDMRNLFNPKTMREMDLNYYSLGRP